MKISNYKKYTTAILYIINYAVAALLLTADLFFMFNFGNALLLTGLLLPLAIFTFNTIKIKKWYHFLGCSFPHIMANVIKLVIIYLSYMSYNEVQGIHLPVDSISQLLTFGALNIITNILLIWLIAACVFKYKFYTVKKSPMCYVSYALTIVSFGLLTLWEKMLFHTTIFSQIDYTVIIFPVGILLILVLILMPISKNNQQ